MQPQAKKWSSNVASLMISLGYSIDNTTCQIIYSKLTSEYVSLYYTLYLNELKFSFASSVEINGMRMRMNDLLSKENSQICVESSFRGIRRHNDMNLTN